MRIAEALSLSANALPVGETLTVTGKGRTLRFASSDQVLMGPSAAE